MADLFEDEDDISDEIALDLAKMSQMAARRMGGGFASRHPYDFHTTEATSFNARITTAPSDTYKKAYDDLITGLIESGIWSSSDTIVMLAAPDAQSSLLCLKNAYNPTLIGTPAFTAGLGYTGGGEAGTTNRLNTTFNPSTASTPQYAQNDCSCSVWIGNDVATNQATFGNASMYLQPRTVTTNLFTGRNQAGSSSNSPGANSKGLHCWGRTASGGGGEFRWKNGASLTVTSGAVSAAVTNAAMQVLSISTDANTSTYVHSYYRIGKAITTTQRATEYTLVSNYLSKIGYPNF